MSDVEELIKEIALKHGIAVGREDPLLILHTINQRLMQESARAQQEMLDRYKEEIETLAKRWGDDAKVKAEKILNAALSASEHLMAKAGEEGMAGMVQTVKAEIEASVFHIHKPIQAARYIAILNIVAAAITLGAAFLVLWSR